MLNRMQLRTAVSCAAQEHRSVVALTQANDVLLQENNRLVAAQESVRQLVSGLSHDMRSHLSVINDYTSLVREGLAGETSPQQREYLGTVGDRVDDLTCMIDDLHDASKLIAGTLRLWRREYCLEDILERRRAHWEHRAAGRRLDFDCTVADDLPAVYCDVDRIARVLHQLVVDAIKRAPVGGAVSVWARTDANREVVLGVTQVGQLPDADEVQRISAELRRESFDVVGATERRLPLAISNAVVRLHLGELTIGLDAPEQYTYSMTLPVYDPLAIVGCHAQRLARTISCSSELSLQIVHLDDEAESGVASVVDEFLQSAVGPNDLVVQVTQRRWLLATTGQPGQFMDLPQRLTADWSETMRDWPFGPAPRLEISIAGSWQGATASEQMLSEAQQLLRLLDEERTADQRPTPKRQTAEAVGSR